MKSLRIAFCLCLIASLTSVVAFCDGVVTEPTENSLRNAVAAGGVVTFGVDGTIVLAQTLLITNDTVIDGTGHSVVLSGNDTVRVLTVPVGVSLTLSNLTVAHGHDAGLDSTNGTGGVGAGGAVWVEGTLIAIACHFWTNSASGGSGSRLLYLPGISTGTGGEANGGAICVSGGNLLASDSEFVGNVANGGPSPTQRGTGGRGSGGAVFQNGGLVHLNRCQLLHNNANGGSVAPATPIFPYTGVSGNARGGAICASGGTSVILECAFNANSSATYEPTNGYLEGGNVTGGAVFCGDGLVTLGKSSFVSNTVAGGSSSWHVPPGNGQGGAIYSTSSLTMTNCSLVANYARPGSTGFTHEQGQGGAMYNGGAATVMNSLFSSNVVSGELGTGGFPNDLSQAKGGAIYNADNLVIIGSTLEGNLAVGAQGSFGDVGPGFWVNPGADAFGGGLYNLGTVWSTNNTFANNQARGGLSVIQSNGGNAYGGALYNSSGTVFLAFTTLNSNSAVGGLGQTNGTGFGSALGGTNSTTTLDSCLVANSPSGANNFGPLIDAGHNLSSDSSCNFTSADSLNNTDPKLGPLGDNGGPTPTCALLPGSPAVDTGNASSALSTDQRGEPRPAGSSPDIGAFELGSASLEIREERTGNTLTLSFTAKANQSYRLLASTNLADWIPVATNAPTVVGTAQFVRSTMTNRSEFYRLVTP